MLIGGAGEDLFVLSAEAPEQIIQDFERGQDRLDLSAFDFLRAPTQLAVTATQTGGVLSFGERSVTLISADGQPLDLPALFGPTFLWPDRMLALNHGNGQEIWAVAGGGFLSGSEGDDTMTGAAGTDNLWSQAGDDLLSGGAGADSLSGGLGDDVLSGDAGQDVFGFAHNQGHDVITDFESGTDLLQLFGASNSFDGLTVTQDTFGNAVLELGSGQLTLLEVSAAALSAEFVFL